MEFNFDQVIELGIGASSGIPRQLYGREDSLSVAAWILWRHRK